MKVLINSWRDLGHPKAGGSEIVVDRLATGLVHRGHDVTVRVGGPVDERDRAYDVVPGGGTYTQYLRGPIDRARLPRHDVVVDVNNGMAYHSPALTRTATVGLVHHIHTDQWPLYFNRGVAAFGAAQEERLMPWTYRHSILIATSPSTQRGLIELGVHPDRVRRLPLWAELPSAEHTTRSPEPLFVACGRLTAHKRLDLLFEMWGRVQPVLGGRLVIIGDGPEQGALEAIADDSISLVGRVSDQEKAELFHQAWGLVHAAPWEGWGLVITEAGLASTPSIGFDVRGVRDAIIDRRTGLLAESSDDFVRRWIDLGTDPALRDSLGGEAHRYARELSKLDQAAVFESALIEAMELHHHRRRRRTRLPAGEVIDLRDTKATTSPSSHRSDDPQPSGPEISVVVPAYNEGPRLPLLLAALERELDLSRTEVLIVDDGSTDDTALTARQHMASWPSARVVTSPRNRGKGAALRLGVEHARGRSIVFMDADNATDLRDLPALLHALDTHHVAIGSRTATGSSVRDGQRHRRLMGQAFGMLVRATTQIDLGDTQCGFKAFRGSVARLLFHLSEIDGFAQDVEILDIAGRLGFSVAEVPVRWTAVPGSKVAPVRHGLQMARDVLKHRMRPLNAAVLAGLTIPGAELDPQVLAKEAGRALRDTDPIIIDGSSVHVLLPGVDATHLPAIAGRIAEQTRCSSVARWSIDAHSLLRLSDEQTRSGLAALGERNT